MEQFNIALDGFSAVICLMMGVYVMVGPGRRALINRWFAGMCAANVLMALGDVNDWMHAGSLSEAECAIVVLGAVLLYGCSVVALACFTGYMTTLLSRRVAVAPAYLRISVAVAAAYVALCLASIGGGMFFYAEPAEGYHRGPWYGLSQAVPLALYLLNALVIVQYRKHLRAKDVVGFASFILLPLVAEIVQMASYGIALLNAAVTASILLMFMNIQSESEALLARRDKELAEARADIMLSQIQPHFLYNTLAVIRELCTVDPPEAAAAVTGFSSYLRENMAALTSKEPVPFERELAHAETYLRLEQKRFGDRLRVEFDVAARDFSLPPLSVQPLVENAVRHGVTQRVEGGCVRVSAREAQDSFVVEVADDGVGFDPSAALPDGLDIGGGSLEVASAPGAGTVATIRIPKGARV